MNSPLDDLKSLLNYLVIYQRKKTHSFGFRFEKKKNIAVDLLMLKRGRFQKHVWHSAMVGLLLLGVVSSGVMGGNSIVASSFPGSEALDPTQIQTYDPFASGISLNSLINLKTSVSQKPRSEILDYTVKRGDTVSSIADKFGISVETIKWANNLDNIHSIKPGDSLKILPVSGVAVKVRSGDTLEALAKRYSADSQAILDFPFNDIPDNLALSIGQTIIVPDGSPPDVPSPVKKIPSALAQGISTGGVFSAVGGGSFIWPTLSQGVSTFFAWWHPGIDLPNRFAPSIVASDGGTVLVAGWPDSYGYGNRVVIDHGNGYQTLYAHLSNIYVGVGQIVSRGQTIGQMGSTGRSTGTHLHFEIHFKGIAINPLAILH